MGLNARNVTCQFPAVPAPNEYLAHDDPNLTLPALSMQVYKAKVRSLGEVVAVKMVDFDKITCDLVRNLEDAAC